MRARPDPDGERVIEETIKAGVFRIRRVFLLEKWLNEKVINSAEFVAGKTYESAFNLAGMGPKYATGGMERVDKTSQDNEPPHRVIAAKKWVEQAHKKVGSAKGVLRDVVGEGMSLRRHAIVRQCNREQAQGKLEMALEILAKP